MKVTELFERGEFVVSAEVGPPKGCHLEGLVEEAKEFLGGISAVNVTDCQSSVMRLGSLATCIKLKEAVQEGGAVSGSQKSQGMTLGNFIKTEK